MPIKSVGRRASNVLKIPVSKKNAQSNPAETLVVVLIRRHYYSVSSSFDRSDNRSLIILVLELLSGFLRFGRVQLGSSSKSPCPISLQAHISSSCNAVKTVILKGTSGKTSESTSDMWKHSFKICKMTVEGSKNDFSRLARTKAMLFEVREIKESGNRMRTSGFRGGIGGQSKHVAHSQSAGRVKEVRSDGSLQI